MTHVLGSTDYVGIAAVIAAVFSGLAAVIAAMNNRTVRDVHRQVGTNGDPRTIGEITSDLGAQVAPAAAVTDTNPHGMAAGTPAVTPAPAPGDG